MAGVGVDPDNKIDQDLQERYSPVSSDLYKQEQAGYDREFNDIASNFDGTADPGQENANIDKVRNAEETGGGQPWATNVSGNQPGKSKGKLSGLKKGGIGGLIATIILGGGAGVFFLGAPGMLLVNLKETMLEKFNYQLPSMTNRSSLIMASKIKGATSGVCGSTITIRCRYNTMSETEVAKFQQRSGDFKINTEKSALPGRVKVASIEYKGQTVSAQDFQSRIQNDLEFRSAVQKGFGYNPKFAGLNTKGALATLSRLKVSKRSPIEGAANDEERTKKLNEATKNGNLESPKTVTTKDTKADGKNYTQAEVDQINAANEAITSEIENASKNGASISAESLDAVASPAKLATSGVVNAVKVTGGLDMSCQAYQALQDLGYAAKTVRALQLASYAMTFMTVADKIKAGTAEPGEVAYLGTILTKEMRDSKGTLTQKSATDSAGFKYAAYGDTSGYKNSASASRFMAGGGLTGSLLNVSTLINDSIPGGAPKKTCAFLKNPIVQAGSLIAGLALFVTGVGTVAQVAKDVGMAAGQIAIGLALAAIPGLFKDMVAGTVTAGISGEDSGNAIASGTSTILSQVASANGNAPMSKDDALAYTGAQDTAVAEMNAQDRATLSPFDISNKNTFLGSMAFQFMPLMTANSTIGAASSFGSLMSGAFTGLMPKTHALTQAEQADALNICQDEDYKALGIATDPTCNVISGIPPKYLNRDPNRVLDSMQGQYDEATGKPVAGSAYETFYNKCLDRDLTHKPYGYGDDGESDKDCVINDSNANFYLFNMDNNVVLDGIENGYTTTQASTDTSTTSAQATTAPATGTAPKGDDYPYKSLPIGQASPLGYYSHECVDFVAWRLNEQSGITQSPFKFAGFGYAIEWRANALAKGYAVDKKPAVGSVAWWGDSVTVAGLTSGPSGHVAIVSGVNSDGSLTVEQYNGEGPPNDHKYGVITVPANQVNRLDYLHIADIKGGV